MRVPMILLAMTAAACAPTRPTVPADIPVDSAFELAIGQAVRVRDADATVQLVSVPEDSRCPVSPTIRCVWAGNGRVRLRVERGAQVDTLDLNTTLQPRERLAGTLNLRLVALSPEPTGDKSIPAGDYRARLVASVRAP